jgi:succinate dehydrogenase / fumarate reductase cytochrome b subunit
VQDKRPVNLDLSTIRLPITAYSSILHRISGILIFGGVAVLLWALQQSLAGEESFNQLKECLSGAFAKLVIWAILSGVIYHFLAGIKHLIMDMGIGETLEGGKKLSLAVLALSAVGILLAGVWIW